MSIPIIVLHYWAGSGRSFELVRRQLQGQRLLTPDLPGFGGRIAPSGFDHSVGSHADWLGAFVAKNRLSNYLLVGHSMGGKIALAWAARRPAGLQGLLLLSPSPPEPEPITRNNRAASMAAYGHPIQAEKTLAVITAALLPARVRELVVQDNLRTSHSAWNAWLERGSREDISALMPRVQVPCWLLVGSADRAITPHTQRQLTLPHLPANTSFEVVPEAGHLLPLEAPAVVAAKLATIIHQYDTALSAGHHMLSDPPNDS